MFELFRAGRGGAKLCAAGALLVFTLAVRPAAAVELPLAERAPASPMLYVGWAGADAMSERYDASKLKRVIEDTGLIERWAPMVAALLAEAKRGGEMPPEARELFAALEPMTEAAWRRPWALTLDRVDFAGGEPQSRVTWVMDAGEMRETVDAAVDALRDRMSEREPGLEIVKISDDNTVGLIVGTPGTVNGNGEATGYAPVAFAARTMDRPMLAVHFDANRLYTRLIAAAEAEGAIGDAERAVIEALGLGDLGHVVYAAGFEGPNWRTETHVQAAAPRRGVLGLIDGEPIDDAMWSLVPPTATWARLHRFDVADVLDLIRETMQNAGEGDDFDQGLAAFSDEMGIDLERDIVDALGDAWVIYSEPTFAASMGPGVCLINDLSDGDRLAAALDTLRDGVNSMLQKNPGPMSLQIARLDLGAVTVDTLAFPFFSLTWAVADGRFYLAMSPDAVLTAHAAAGDPGRSLADSDKLQSVQRQLRGMVAGDDDVEPVGLMFADLRGSAVKMYPLYAMLLNLASGPIMQETGVNALTLLPPLGRLMPHLEPAGAMTWFDDAGMHGVSLTPFPGSILLSPEVTWSSTPTMGAGFMLPAFFAARRSAHETVSMSNLRQIGIALVTYAVDHDGRLPERLSALFEPGYIASPEAVLTTPHFAVAQPDDLADRELAERAEWYSRNGGYVYIPWPSLEDIDRPSERILVFEKPGHAIHRDMPAAAFADGHTERMPRNVLGRRIEQQTGVSLERWVEAAGAGRVPEGFTEARAQQSSADDAPAAPH
mgnify:CR=1 FL=1